MFVEKLLCVRHPTSLDTLIMVKAIGKVKQTGQNYYENKNVWNEVCR